MEVDNQGEFGGLGIEPLCTWAIANREAASIEGTPAWDAGIEGRRSNRAY